MKKSMFNKGLNKLKTLVAATLIMLGATSAAYADGDVIYLHNGQEVKGKVYRVTEKTVVFSYENEDVEQAYGKWAVDKVVFGKSGRVQNVTARIEIHSEDDWEKVIIIDNTDEVTGLQRRGEVKGKTRQINYRTGEGSDRKALEKLKKDAAEKRCPFVYITTDKDIDRKSDDGGSFGQIQSIKKGVAYGY
jgi:hypothetical protein